LDKLNWWCMCERMNINKQQKKYNDFLKLEKRIIDLLSKGP